jgi:DNA-directed RNA polymerase specialized sigma24 family protein
VFGRRRQPDETSIARVYGAAMAAAADPDAAGEATLRAFAAAGAGAGDADALAAAAVRLAVRAAPHPAFAPMDVADREAVALARLLRWPEHRIAAVLEIDIAEVRRRLTRGLRSARPETACV